MGFYKRRVKFSMKTNHMSDVTKVLILVATVIVVCVICAIGFKMVNEGKSAVNASTNNFNNMTSQYSDIDKAIYNGATVQGSEVVNLIKKAESKNGDEYLAIGVLTLARKEGIRETATDRDYTYYNKIYSENGEGMLDASSTYSEAVENKPNPEALKDYINPSAQFQGEVKKDNNGLIICIQFTQLN